MDKELASVLIIGLSLSMFVFGIVAMFVAMVSLDTLLFYESFGLIIWAVLMPSITVMELTAPRQTRMEEFQ